MFLLLFVTGLRYRVSPSAVTARIGDAGAEVFYAGSQGGFVGLDRIPCDIFTTLQKLYGEFLITRKTG